MGVMVVLVEKIGGGGGGDIEMVVVILEWLIKRGYVRALSEIK